MKKVILRLLFVILALTLSVGLISCKEPANNDDGGPSHTHTYTIKTTNPTCSEQGYSTFTCDCGHSYNGDYKEALGGTCNFVNGYCTKCLTQLKWSGATASAFSGGDGTETNPYQISTGEQLAFLSKQINSSTTNEYYNKYYELVCDINLNGLEWDPIGCYWYGTFSSSCSNSLLFAGYFEGNNHVISNFKVTQQKTDILFCYYGLFGGVSGTIKNLGVADFTIDMASENVVYAGGIMGYGSSSKISNCYAKNGTINLIGGVRVYAGGLVGHSLGKIEKSYANLEINAGVNASEKLIYAGGLVGYNQEEISNCYASGSVNAVYQSSTSYVGGLAGYNVNKIVNSYASTSVSVESSEGSIYAGGCIGYNKNTSSSKKLENNFACGNVSVVTDKSTVFASGFMAYDSGYNFTNVYRYNLQEIAVEVGSEGQKNTYTYGTESTPEQLNSATFYTSTLKWDATVWNLSNLDVANYKLPTLN